MCGRYEAYISPDQEGKRIKERAEELKLTYSEGEIFPSNEVLCFVPNETNIDLASMKWGMKTKGLHINARVESINDKSMYRNIKNNRCAIIASGFFEWDRCKRKYLIKTHDKYFYLACIFNESNELLIITKQADNSLISIHNRMPIIMNKEEMLNYIHNVDNKVSKKELIIKEVSEQISLF